MPKREEKILNKTCSLIIAHSSTPQLTPSKPSKSLLMQGKQKKGRSNSRRSRSIDRTLLRYRRQLRLTISTSCYVFSARMNRRTSRCSSSWTCRAMRSRNWSMRFPNWRNSSGVETMWISMISRSFYMRWRTTWPLLRAIWSRFKASMAIARSKPNLSWVWSRGSSSLSNATDKWLSKLEAPRQ